MSEFRTNSHIKSQKGKSIALIIIGCILCGCGVFFMLPTLIQGELDSFLALFIVMGCVPLAVGGLLLLLGILKKRVVSSFYVFLPRLDTNPEMTARELAACLGKNESSVRSLLKKQVTLKFYGNAYFDMALDKIVFITVNEAMTDKIVLEESRNKATMNQAKKDTLEDNYSQPKYKEETSDNKATEKPRYSKYKLSKVFWLGIITFGIYRLVTYCRLTKNINEVASEHDHKKTRNYLVMFFLLSLPTIFIYTFVWHHKLCKRIGDELAYRRIDYSFGPSKFWILNVLLAWTFVCPLVFEAKLFKAMNYINYDYYVNKRNDDSTAQETVA